MSDDRRLIEDLPPIQATCLRATCLRRHGRQARRQVSAEASRKKSDWPTTNEWYKAQQLAKTYWLYVVWNPLGDSPELVRIHNPATTLDHAKREIVAARFFEIPAEAVDRNSRTEEGSS